MKKINLILLPILASYLMACDQIGEETAPEETEPVACPAQTGEFDDLIGQLYAQVEDRFSGEGQEFALREPGKIYTAQAVLGRTLIYVDENGVILRVHCG